MVAWCNFGFQIKALPETSNFNSKKHDDSRHEMAAKLERDWVAVRGLGARIEPPHVGCYGSHEAALAVGFVEEDRRGAGEVQGIDG